MHNKQLIGIHAVIICLLAIGIAILIPQRHSSPEREQASFGGGQLESFSEIPTASFVWVGRDLDTTVVATSTGREYLEIGNISGATSSPTAVYCNTNGRAASLYSGIVIQASTTKVFGLDSLPYRGALHCRSANASSTVTIVER